MSCCGKKRKQVSKGTKPTLASPVGMLMRPAGEQAETSRKPVTPPVTRR